MKKLFTLLVILLTMFMVSCTKKQLIQRPETLEQYKARQAATSGETSSSTANKSADKTQGRDIAAEKAAAEKAAAEKAAAEKTAAEKAAAEKSDSPFSDIYFDYDSDDIKPNANASLKKISNLMISNPNNKISAEGHCDERGTAEYNLALGDRRAKATKDHLVSLGVSSAKISTFSYGKEAPVCTEHAEKCWSKNRRVHFVLTTGGAK